MCFGYLLRLCLDYLRLCLALVELLFDYSKLFVELLFDYSELFVKLLFDYSELFVEQLFDLQ